MDNILIIDNETVARSKLKRLLERNYFSVSEASSIREVREQHCLSDFSLVICGSQSTASNENLLDMAGDTPVLFLSGYISEQDTNHPSHSGATDFISQPYENEEMLAAINSILKHRPDPPEHKAQVFDDSHAFLQGMIGRCPEMLTLYDHIHKVAPTTVTVLIHGETGTGKELVARAIHHESQRTKQPLICVNCAAIPETLIESELFGYEKGAFTGASANRVGLIEAADGGTLFLDEIGELPVEAQARLLRFIQEGEIRSIGSVHSRKVDVRLVTATHRNLHLLCKEGKFREDLYYRINVVQLTLPPLRDRKDDIITIAKHLLKEACQRFGQPEKFFSLAALDIILRYDWPGNIRELENIIERVVILSDKQEISSECLAIESTPHTITDPQIQQETPVKTPTQHIEDDPIEDLSLEDYFQRFVLEHQGQMSETELAKKLGVSRKCLWERRQRFGIPRQKAGPAKKVKYLDHQ